MPSLLPLPAPRFRPLPRTAPPPPRKALAAEGRPGRSARGAAAFLLAVTLLAAAPGTAPAQSVRDALDRLFVFGGEGEPLFLGGSAGVPATEVHGDHFIPAETEANAALLDFFTSAIARNVSSFPIPTTVASETFVFVEGVPTPTSTSFGPISAERAQTIGRGRLNVGVSYTALRFKEIRGVDMDDIQLNFLHQNVDFPGCDQVFGGDCSLFGVPQFENDLIGLTLDLDIAANVYAFYATYGIADRVDLSVAVPIVDMDFFGSSRALIVPSTGSEALHFFGGTPERPILEARTQEREQATGLGDVAVRLKGLLARGDTWHVAVLGETRLPTGREEDFLGTGEANAKGLLILSGTFSGFSPHANVGYEFRGSDLDEDEFEAVIGFDHLLADWVTLAVDVLSTFKLGDPAITLPESARLEAPFPVTVERTNVPDERDDIVDGALGFKFRTDPGLVIIANIIVPLNEGGLRSSPIPTLALEFTH